MTCNQSPVRRIADTVASILSVPCTVEVSTSLPRILDISVPAFDVIQIFTGKHAPVAAESRDVGVYHEKQSLGSAHPIASYRFSPRCCQTNS